MRPPADGWSLRSPLPFAAPLGYLAVRTWRRGAGARHLGDRRPPGPALRSLLLASTVAVAAAAAGTAAGLAGHAHRPARPARLRLLLPLPLVLPVVHRRVRADRGVRPRRPARAGPGPIGVRGCRRSSGFWARSAVLTLLTYPYVYLPVAARLRAAARRRWRSRPACSGAARCAVFRTVVLPQARAADRSPARCWCSSTCVSDFGAVQLLRLRHADARHLRQPAARPAIVARAQPAAGAAGDRWSWWAERAASRAGGTPTRAARAGRCACRLGRWRGGRAARLAGAVVGLALVAPLARARPTGRCAALGEGADRGRRRSSRTRAALVEPAVNTAVSSAAAALVAVAVVLPVAYLTSRRRGRGRRRRQRRRGRRVRAAGAGVALALVFWTLDSAGASARSTRPSRCWWARTSCTSAPRRCGPAQVAVASVPAGARRRRPHARAPAACAAWRRRAAADGARRWRPAPGWCCCRR